MVYIALFFIVLVLIGIGIFLLKQKEKYRPEIPASALEGIATNSTKKIAYFELSDWARNVSPNAYLAVFKGDLLASGEAEMRVFLGDGENTHFAGVLSDELGLSGVKTLFVNLDGERCIVGWVSSSMESPLYFHIERYEPDNEADGWANEKESTIEKGIAEANGGWFIVPITEDIQLWNTLIQSSVISENSLDRGSKDLGSWYEVEKNYSSPLDVSSWYIHVPIQK